MLFDYHGSRKFSTFSLNTLHQYKYLNRFGIITTDCKSKNI